MLQATQEIIVKILALLDGLVKIVGKYASAMMITVTAVTLGQVPASARSDGEGCAVKLAALRE